MAGAAAHTGSPTIKLNDVGTNAPVLTTKTSQATPPNTQVNSRQDSPIFPESASTPVAGKAPQQPGASAPSDDSGKHNVTQNDVVINTAGNSPILPKPNVLDQYASYTYSLSWYLLTPEQYRTMQATSKIDTNQWSLLIQSGGAPTQYTSINPVTNRPTTTDANVGTTSYYGPSTSYSDTTGRNKYFNLDYYMDDLKISSAFFDKGPSTTVNLEFTVTEPNGITLLMNLNSAIRDLLQQPKGSVQNAHFVMVIRFYGYDAQGNLVTNIGQEATPNNTNYAVIKYFPFILGTLNFQMAKGAVVYHITGTVTGYNYAMTSALGSVPHNIQLTGETVADILNGRTVSSKTNQDDGRKTKDSPSVLTGPQNKTVYTDEAGAGSFG